MTPITFDSRLAAGAQQYRSDFSYLPVPDPLWLRRFLTVRDRQRELV
jgi:hypothetical protein